MRVLTLSAGRFLFATLIVATPIVGQAAWPAIFLARQTLPANDGWGSFSTGTTGGSAATPDHIYVATNRSELVAALSIGATPKIVYISGTIDANVDANNLSLACSAYEAPGYSLAGYLAAYDPAVWGRTTVPSGPLENARRTSQLNQQARVRINVPANTTLLGLGNSTILGANLRVNNTDNVIIRNIRFVDANDCFPAWDPTDGSLGNWNSAYDNISLTGATHVWVDHCQFDDGTNPDSSQPLYFGRPFQGHDGALDITNASDLITVSWNRFVDHDKVMLIGSSDNASADVGKLRVTLHHNVFANVVQRMPRVRYGQVHVYNNVYDVAATANYGYSWGVGVQSRLYAQNNFLNIGGFAVDRVISRFNGTMIFAEGSFVNGLTPPDQIDIVAAYNLARDPDLTPAVDWTPTLVTMLLPTPSVPGLVGPNAGPFKGTFQP